jgi:hypothetical protein
MRFCFIESDEEGENQMHERDKEYGYESRA